MDFWFAFKVSFSQNHSLFPILSAYMCVGRTERERERGSGEWVSFITAEDLVYDEAAATCTCRSPGLRSCQVWAPTCALSSPCAHRVHTAATGMSPSPGAALVTARVLSEALRRPVKLMRSECVFTASARPIVPFTCHPLTDLWSL